MELGFLCQRFLFLFIYFFAILFLFLATMCVVLSRAHVHSGAGRRAGSDPAAAHLSHLPVQMLQD